MGNIQSNSIMGNLLKQELEFVSPRSDTISDYMASGFMASAFSPIIFWTACGTIAEETVRGAISLLDQGGGNANENP